MRNTVFFAAFFLVSISFAFAELKTPESFYAYQNAVYAQTDSLLGMEALYAHAADDIKMAEYPIFRETALLAAIQELRVRSLLLFDKTEEAEKSLASGITLAEQSLAQKPDSESYAVLGSLYSIGIKVKTGTMISTGLKIQDVTKKALKLNADNPIAVHLQAAGYVYAPIPFRNLKKGITYVTKYLEKVNLQTLSKAELFNLTMCLADACQMIEDTESKQYWLDKSALLFPKNKSITERDFLKLK